MNYKIYLIRWKDHFSTDNWTGLEDISSIADDEIVNSVGYLIRKDKYHYHLAQNITDSSFKNTISIMTNSVVSAKELVV